MDKNAYQSKPIVYPDGTVQRPRPKKVQPPTAPPSSKIRHTMGAPAGSAPAVPRQSGRPVYPRGVNPSGQRPVYPGGANPTGQRPAQPRQQASRVGASAPQKRAAGSVKPQNGQAPRKQPQNKKATPKNAKAKTNVKSSNGGSRQSTRPNNGWVIPEGSAIYTPDGRMYEAVRRSMAGSGNAYGQQRAYGQQKAPAHGRNPQQQRRKSPPPKKKKKRRNIGKVLLFWTKAFVTRFLIFFVITALLGLWWYRSEFYSNVGESGKKITYSVQNGSGTSFTADVSSAWSCGVMYVNMSALYPEFNMAAVGSLDSMRFIIKEETVRDSSGNGGEEYVIFTDGSRTANINGTAVIMQARCRVIGEDIWIPLSFIENYVDGVDVDHTADDSVIFTSPEYLNAVKENKESKKPKKLDVGDYPIKLAFRLTRPSMPDHVLPPE